MKKSTKKKLKELKQIKRIIKETINSQESVLDVITEAREEEASYLGSLENELFSNREFLGVAKALDVLFDNENEGVGCPACRYSTAINNFMETVKGLNVAEVIASIPVEITDNFIQHCKGMEEMFRTFAECAEYAYDHRISGDWNPIRREDGSS